MVNGVRVSEKGEPAYRAGHQLGNALLTGIVKSLFGDRIEDMLSGYKVFSRRYVKSFPSLTKGFEIETELTVHALELKMPIAHMRTVYRGRPKGSHSKLNTYRDGRKILLYILDLFRQERPLLFFSVISFALMVAALAIGSARHHVLSDRSGAAVPDTIRRRRHAPAGQHELHQRPHSRHDHPRTARNQDDELSSHPSHSRRIA